MNAFEKRLNYIARYHPELAKRLSDAPVADKVPADSPNFFSDLPEAKSVLVHILGIGPAYNANKATEWMENSPNIKVVFHEPNISILKAFLQSEIADQILYHPNILIESYTSDELDSYYGKALVYSVMQLDISHYPPSMVRSKMYRLKEEEISKYESLILYTFAKNLGDSEYLTPGVISLNGLVNLLQVPFGSHAKALKGKFSDVPLVFCGGAPSIKDAKEFLKNIDSRALIVTGSTGVNALQELGIRPHIIISLDPSKNLFSKFADYYQFEVPFFYSPRTEYESMQYYSAPFVYSTNQPRSICHSIQKKFDIGTAPLEFDDSFGHGLSVTSYSIFLAHHFGCQEVYLVGVDFAYEEGVNRYSVKHPQHPVIKEDSKADFPEMPIYPVSRSGGSKNYKMTFEFQREIQWLHTFQGRYKKPKITFASAIGAEVSAFPRVTFSEKMEAWSDKGDLHKRLKNELDKGATKWITLEQILNLYREKKKETEELIQLLNQAFLKLQRLSSEENSLKRVLLETEIVREIQIFYSSSTYFDDLSAITLTLTNALRAGQKFWNINIDEMRTKIVKTYLLFLHQNWMHLSKVLFQQCKEKGAVRKGPRCSEITEERIRLYHQNGHLKREINFKDGVKNGKEICFSADGTRLLEAEFVNDKVVGTPFYRGLYD